MDLEEFRSYAQEFNVIPVSRRYLADSQTPLSLYKKLAEDRVGTFLLESAEHGGVWSRYSFIGINSASTLTERDGKAIWLGVTPSGAPTGIDPLEALKIAAKHLRSPHLPHLPPLTGGLVGYAGYEIVRRLERIPSLAAADLALPEIAFMLTSDLAVFDHYDGTLTLIANAINWDGSSERVDAAFEDANARLDALELKLKAPAIDEISHPLVIKKPNYQRDMSSVDYQAKVEILKEEIRAGEAFQVVLSQRFVMEASAEPFDIYRALRASNPSPYMYLFRFEDGLSIVGSSPEALVKITGDDVMLHPIAGTRPRSSDPEIDQRHGEELLAEAGSAHLEALMLWNLCRSSASPM
jgi:anthranilate synthase component 1